MATELPADITNLFRSGSKTYFNSSLFFPEDFRREVTILYAFVRQADNFVDQKPQDNLGFEQFVLEFKQARQAQPSDNPVINYFVRLESDKGFDPKWADSFLGSMRLDLTKKTYQTLADTEHYIYGSANVIGLFMARLMDLPPEAYPYAEKLGQSMQYINFIRDIQEDVRLGRTYFPQTDLKEFGLESLDQAQARQHPEEFKQFLQKQLQRYHAWQTEAEQGFRFIPRRFLIPIKTASDMYKWTAEQISQNPFLVYQRPVKPGKLRVLLTGLTNWLFFDNSAQTSLHSASTSHDRQDS
jgi:phytoene synthase